MLLETGYMTVPHRSHTSVPHMSWNFSLRAATWELKTAHQYHDSLELFIALPYPFGIFSSSGYVATWLRVIVPGRELLFHSVCVYSRCWDIRRGSALYRL